VFRLYPPKPLNSEYHVIRSRKGRRRLLSGTNCLVLVLALTRTRGSLITLQLIFGLSFSSVDECLKFGIRVLINVLSNHNSIIVAIPSDENIDDYEQMIKHKYPELEQVWCTCDGIKLKIQSPSEYVTQSRFYNSYVHGHFIGAVICFYTDSTIPIVERSWATTWLTSSGDGQYLL